MKIRRYTITKIVDRKVELNLTADMSQLSPDGYHLDQYRNTQIVGCSIAFRVYPDTSDSGISMLQSKISDPKNLNSKLYLINEI